MSSTIELNALVANYYTLGQAARAAGVNRVTLWRWIRDGKLHSERIGREVLIERKAIEALRNQ